MATEELDAVVLGAGLAGLHQLHLLRSAGLRVLAYDAADDVGGAWWWHDFPGARLDVPSHLYQYFLSEQLYRDWGWSERFPGGYEVLRWLRFVADRLDLRRDVRLGTRIVAARFDGPRARWRLEGEAGETVDARFVVAATGTLPTPDVLEGSGAFGGPVLATSRWPPRTRELAGRVGVVARGASAVQLVPTLADRVGHLTVFVHEAHDVVPRHNPMYGWQERERDASRYAELRDTLPHTPDGDEPDRPADPAGTADLTALRDAMRARLGDPRLSGILVPTGGPRRVLPDDGWLEVFHRHDVTLVDARSAPVVRACRDGVVLADGAVHELDAIVLAGEVDTGVDALGRIDVRGRGGRSWAADRAGGAPTTLGVATHGHPNLFLTASPRPPSAAVVNLAVARQEQSAWVARAITDLVAGGGTTIEAREPLDVVEDTSDLGALRRRRLAERAAGYPSFSRS